MKFTTIILTSILLVLADEAFSQKSVFVNIGYGKYELKSLKRFHSRVASSFPVEAKHTTNFPDTFYPELEFIFNSADNFSMSAFLRYQSTGSRYYYEDYSGLIYNDLIFEGFTLGIINAAILHRSDHSQTSIPIRIGFNYTILSSETFVEVYAQSDEGNEKYYSFGGSFGPELSHTRFFNDFLIRGKIGYEINIATKTFVKGVKDAYLVDNNGDKVRTQFNGFRFLFGVGYQF